MRNIYLVDREVTDENLRPLAQALLNIARSVGKLEDVVFLNFLRGCDIPTKAVCRLLDNSHTILTIPLSPDEVSRHTLELLLDEHLADKDLSDKHLVWIEEALSLGMGAGLLSYLSDFLGDNFKRFSVHFLCAENASMLHPGRLTLVEDVVRESRGRIEVNYIPVPVLHWMDNNKTLGMNWGRRYTFILHPDWIPDKDDYDAASDSKQQLEEYKPGGPLQFIKEDSLEFGEYVSRRRKFIQFCYENVPYRDKHIEGGELYVGDMCLPIPRLEECVNDPHTLWCREDMELSQKYRWLRSDPKTIVVPKASNRAEYDARLLAMMRSL